MIDRQNFFQRMCRRAIFGVWLTAALMYLEHHTLAAARAERKEPIHLGAMLTLTGSVAADLGYDSLKMVAESLRKSDLTVKGISAHLAAIENFPGASGSITLDENHERVERPVNLFQVKDGVVSAIAR